VAVLHPDATPINGPVGTPLWGTHLSTRLIRLPSGHSHGMLAEFVKLASQPADHRPRAGAVSVAPHAAVAESQT
jgi:hypothetical protein